MQQAHRHCFVTNNGTLLAQGQTVENIAVGQVGIIDAKTRKAVTSPTYATTKAFQLVWGTPDQGDQALLSGVPNANIYSKLILGKNITGFRGKKAKRPQSQVITVGWSGDVSDTNTLFAKPGESRKLYLTLTGSPIDKLFSKQGITRVYDYTAKLVSDCQDSCVNVDPRDIADSLVKQINGDSSINKFIKASKLQTCTPSLASATTQTIYKFKLTVCDTKDDVALGLVQAQYPGFFVKRISIEGSSSVYEVERTVNTAPKAFSNSGNILIPDCGTCPNGYTTVNNKFTYKVVKQDAGDAASLLSVASAYNIVSPETVNRISYEFGTSTYIISSSVALTPVGAANEVQTVTITGSPTGGTFTLSFSGQTTAAIASTANAATVQAALEALSNINVGDVTVTGGALPGTAVTVTFGEQYANTNVPQMTATSSLTGGTSPAIAVATSTTGSASDNFVFVGFAATACVLNSVSTIAWSANGTLTKYGKTFRITLGDTVCGSNRLSELQAAFPALTVSIVDADGTCVHTYETTVFSNAVETGCAVEEIKFLRPQSFDGVEWSELPTAALPSGTTCLTGVKIEVGYISRVTSEVTFDYFPYDADTVHLKASSFDPNYNHSSLREEWVTKQIRSVQFPVGFGAAVRVLEKNSKGYELLERSFDPVVRENEKYSFQAQPFQYYDEYQIDFVVKTKVGGWGQETSENYTIGVFFPESNGKQFENAVNSYLASAAIQIDPVIL